MPLESKIDKIQDDVSEIKITLAKNTTSLEMHMSRTEANEKRLATLERYSAMAVGAIMLIGLVATVIQALK